MRINLFALARRYMARSLKRDLGLRHTYEANIAMLLYDRHGITGVVERTAAAEDIMELVFGLKVDDRIDEEVSDDL